MSFDLPDDSVVSDLSSDDRYCSRMAAMLSMCSWLGLGERGVGVPALLIGDIKGDDAPTPQAGSNSGLMDRRDGDRRLRADPPCFSVPSCWFLEASGVTPLAPPATGDDTLLLLCTPLSTSGNPSLKGGRSTKLMAVLPVRELAVRGFGFSMKLPPVFLDASIDPMAVVPPVLVRPVTRGEPSAGPRPVVVLLPLSRSLSPLPPWSRWRYRLEASGESEAGADVSAALAMMASGSGDGPHMDRARRPTLAAR